MTQRKRQSTVAARTMVSEHNLKITDARNRLPNLVRAVASSSDTYTIGQRGNQSAMLLSFKRVAPLLKPDIEPKLALVIVEHLLAEAPLHLRTPAVDELSQLPLKDLQQLVTIDSLPLSQARVRSLKKSLEHPEALDRLVRRFNLAQEIERAREGGLYETAEHEASNVRIMTSS